MCLSKISRTHLPLHRRIPPFVKFLSSKPTTAHANITASSKSPLRYDVIAQNRQIIGFVRSNDLDSAFRVFRAMNVRTTVTWNSILAGYVRLRGNFESVQKLFDEIPQPDVVSYNIMLGRYLSEFGVNAAWEFFRKMPLRDVASWNTMISGYARSGRMEEARGVFSMMPARNGVSWSAMISGCVDCGELDLAVGLFGAATVRTVVAWTAMIHGYMKFGKVEEAVKLFEEMPGKSPVTWNALIAGFVENCLAEEGLKAFRRMIETGARPNPSTLCSALLGCSELSALQLGKQIHQFTVKLPVSEDTTAGTSLISMYCKCGLLHDAWKLFDGMSRRDVVTWNAMISGHAQHGLGEVALQMFDEMRCEGFKPDWITFVAVLLACNHAGLIDLGRTYFRSMTKDFGIEPKLDHYSCMIDLLGRAGQLDEAVDLIKEMPFKPHPTIFGTLLGACRVHKNVTLAEFAAKCLLDLDPTSATAYIQLANVYAATKRFDQVSRVRKSMRESQVVKIPGYSWIEIKSTVHEFRSGDTDHPELHLIHEKLKVLLEKIKSAGYVPDLEYALHDVGEEQKEQLLLWHSEKLATAFGILKVPAGVPIRVFKNLRICGDCHRAIKYMSVVEGREIIVRDTSRFHHFVDGACSCGDYWETTSLLTRPVVTIEKTTDADEVVEAASQRRVASNKESDAPCGRHCTRRIAMPSYYLPARFSLGVLRKKIA